MSPVSSPLNDPPDAEDASSAVLPASKRASDEDEDDDAESTVSSLSGTPMKATTGKEHQPQSAVVGTVVTLGGAPEKGEGSVMRRSRQSSPSRGVRDGSSSGPASSVKKRGRRTRTRGGSASAASLSAGRVRRTSGKKTG